VTPLSPRSALRRFLVLAALRWAAPGLIFPVFVLLPLSRGLTLSELGLAVAMQGLVVFALELPTGGLADAVGRRWVLMASAVISLAAVGLFLVAHSFALFALIFALLGVYRALDSGPLEAWYVDTVHATDPDAPIEKGLSAYGTVLGVAIAAGSLTCGGLIALEPVPGVDPLIVPVLLALVIQVAGLVAMAVLMREPHRATGWRAVARSARDTPRTIAEGFGLLRSSRVLLALVSVELFWGFGMVTFEGLMPVRLSEVAGGTQAAAAITGPVVAVAWLASAGGSALTPLLGRWIGVAPTAALMRILQGLAVAAMGLAAGVVGIIVAFIVCNTVHGVSGAAHMTLLHRQAVSSVRATVVSLNSWVAQPAGAVGVIALTALADATSVSTAMLVGAVVLAAAAPLYLPAWRQSRVLPESVSPAPARAPVTPTG
jgi:MFS family permease